MSTKYTFLLPAYKPDFFKEALDSILGQTYKDFNLIILDDCSPYDLKSIVEEYKDSRITFHRNEENMGGKNLVSCWNKLLSYAEGEYIILASDDDVYELNFLEEMDKLAQKYPEVDLLRARVRRIDDKGKIFAEDALYKEHGDCIDYIYQKHFNNGITCMACFVFKTEALKSEGGFEYLPVAWHSDDASSLKVCKNGIANSSQILFNFRTSSVNISGRKITSKDALEKAKATLLYDSFFHKFINEIKSVKNPLKPIQQSKLNFAQKDHDDFCYTMSRTYATLCNIKDFWELNKHVPPKMRLKFVLYYFKMKLFY